MTVHIEYNSSTILNYTINGRQYIVKYQDPYNKNSVYVYCVITLLYIHCLIRKQYMYCTVTVEIVFNTTIINTYNVISYHICIVFSFSGVWR